MVQTTPVEQTSSRSHVEQTPATSGGAAAILSGYDDDTLMTRVQDGDKEAFEVIVARHMDRATAVATRFVANPAAGRVATQAAFVQLWVARDHYRREGGFRWFLTTLVLDQCRKAANLGGSSSPGQNRVATVDPESRKVEDALKKLTKNDRELLVMRYGMELAYQEIANETGQSAATLRSHVYNSLRKLRGLLEGES